MWGGENWRLNPAKEGIIYLEFTLKTRDELKFRCMVTLTLLWKASDEVEVWSVKMRTADNSNQ